MNDAIALPPKHALILEEIPEVADTLATVLRLLFAGIEITRAPSLPNAHHLLASGAGIDLGLININLALADGSAQLIRELLARTPTCRVVVTTLYADDEHLFPALCAGARGYLLRDDPPEKLLTALRTILAGEPLLSPSLAHRVLRLFGQATQLVPLTPPEQEVLALVAKGYRLPDVARRLGFSRGTGSEHLKTICRKLQGSYADT